MQNRKTGPDCVRALAIFCVVLLHAVSLGGGLADAPVSLSFAGKVYLRQLSLACVPLFLMLSGYLQRGRKPDAHHYRSILRPLVSYFLISILCEICYAYAFSDLTFPMAVYKLFDFTANGYAWYFEMYIGLFLLIPFLNMIWAGAGTKKTRAILLCTLAFLTLFPDTVVSFAPYYDPTDATLALQIIPSFFKSMYPVAYYFAGCWLAEYPLRFSAPAKFAFAVCAPLVPTALCVAYTAARGEYAWYMMNGFQTLTAAATAFFLFAWLADTEKRPSPLAFSARLIAKNAFEMYLFSYLWDTAAYQFLHLPMYLGIPFVFLGSFLSAFVLNFLLSLVFWRQKTQK